MKIPLEDRISILEQRLNEIEASLKSDGDPMRHLEIKMIARETARGNKGPLREWNRRHK